MVRITGVLTAVALLCFLAGSANADEITAIDIFDAMIHYENDQLSGPNGVADYHCKITETTVRTGIGAREIIVKDDYFMVPTFELQLIGDKPAFYFDNDLLIVLLESVDLVRLRDAVIDDVACYVIQSTPKNPAYDQYNRIYYVAKDDFRHVRTISHHATREYDNLMTEINYTYAPVGGFNLMQTKVAVTTDDNGNVLATVTSEYSDYEFGIGLTLDFFVSYVEGHTPNIPLN